MQRVAAKIRASSISSPTTSSASRACIVQIDRNKAADLGVSLQTVGRTLETMLGSRIVTTFERGGEEYNVVLQARDDAARLGRRPRQPLRAFGQERRTGAAGQRGAASRSARGPTELRRTDRMRAIELAGSWRRATRWARRWSTWKRSSARKRPTAQIIYNGETYQLKQSGGALWLTFAFALLIVYLVLAAQFESFVHPLVILVAVPLALTGALLGLWLFDSTINIFSQIGCIMLIGIACKNGILIVEFANQLRDRGVEFVDAIIQSSATPPAPGAHDQPGHGLRRACR